MFIDNSVIYLPLSSHPAHSLINELFSITPSDDPININDIILKTDREHKEIQDLFFYKKDSETFFDYLSIFHTIKDLYFFSNKYIKELSYHDNMLLKNKFLSRMGTPLNKKILENEISKETYLIRMALLGRTDKMSETDWCVISSIINIACRDLVDFEEIPKDNRKRKYSCKMNVTEAIEKTKLFIFNNYSQKDFVYLDERKILSRLRIFFSRKQKPA